MSLIWTESFAGFERHEGGNDNDVTERLFAALGTAGYRTVRASTASFLSVVPDPVTPTRAGLRFNGTSGSGSINCLIARELPLTLAPIIFGFSVFIPSDFVPSGTQPSLIVGMHPAGATDLATIHNTPAREAFRIRSDLAICIGAAAPQSVFRPAVGRVSFFEVRVDGSDVSVWMNDALVHQSSRGAGLFGAISLGFTSAIPIPNNWVIGNLYILAADDVAPNVRLGPSTRVIGRRPAADVRADFVRPIGAESNAEVVAQDIAPNPERTLQTSQVGATDIYTTEDDTETAGATIVHAVAVKTVAANLEAMPHTFKPFIRSAGVEADEGGPQALQVIPKFTENSLFVIAEHPTKGIIVAGANNTMYHSTDDGDSWTKISEGENAETFVAGGFSSNGNALLIRGSATLVYCHDSSPIDEWGVQASGATQINRIDSNGDVWGALRSAGSSSDIYRRRIVYPKDGPISVAGIPSLSSFTGSAIGQSGGTWLLFDYREPAAIRRSTDDLLTFTASTASAVSSSNARLIAHGNGIWLLINPATTFSAIRSLDDGVSWQSAVAPPFHLYVAAGNGLRFLESLGLFIALGVSGQIALSPDGVSWRHYRIPGEGRAFTNAIVTKTGRLIVVGDTGLVAVMDPLPQEKQLPVLGGYEMHFNLATVDPATGAPWTPGAAAIAEIGMRVES